MKREIISNALTMLDDKYISEAEVFAPRPVHRAPERIDAMKGYTSKHTVRRFASLLIAACLLLWARAKGKR